MSEGTLTPACRAETCERPLTGETEVLPGSTRRVSRFGSGICGRKSPCTTRSLHICRSWSSSSSRVSARSTMLRTSQSASWLHIATFLTRSCCSGRNFSQEANARAISDSGYSSCKRLSPSESDNSRKPSSETWTTPPRCNSCRTTSTPNGFPPELSKMYWSKSGATPAVASEMCWTYFSVMSRERLLASTSPCMFRALRHKASDGRMESRVTTQSRTGFFPLPRRSMQRFMSPSTRLPS
mmetsp:Transcript_20216/g.45708  ORF Transcript_20216/g.45708 Transcript_20216/m.45708 type:complete len:240 (+) Transcript_20216:267-986(+)